MSKAPKCKLCSPNHWLHEPHVFAGAKKPLAPVAEVEAPVTAEEEARFYRHLEVVTHAFGRFLEEAAESIRVIRDERLFRVRYKTFEEFCQEVFGHPRAWANRLIARASEPKKLPMPNKSESSFDNPVLDHEKAILDSTSDPKVDREAERHGPKPTAKQTADAVAGKTAKPTNPDGDIGELEEIMRSIRLGYVRLEHFFERHEPAGSLRRRADEELAPLIERVLKREDTE